LGYLAGREPLIGMSTSLLARYCESGRDAKWRRRCAPEADRMGRDRFV